MLYFGSKPPFSFAVFLKRCQGFIPDKDIELLGTVSLSGEKVYEKTQLSILRKWRVFEAALRNELVKIRAARRHIEPHKCLRDDKYIELSIVHIATLVSRIPSIIESEKILDQERWRFLDDLAMGHYFDLDFLIIYAYKLLILEKWEKINSADKVRALESVLKKIEN